MGAIKFAGKTDMGRKRTNNEDAYIVQNIWDDNNVLAVAIDGVGGYEGGEVAAAIAQRCIVEYLEKYPNGERLDLIKQAVIYANNTIFEERKSQPQYANMGCVLTAALVELEGQRINMAHIGDTRLYQYADGMITKLSHDHSLVGFREEIGELSEIEAMKHPRRNEILKIVGDKMIDYSDSEKEVETGIFPLLPQSILLLCSDGLCDMVTSEQMSFILRQPISLEEKTTALIDAANEAGGKDNVTVVLVESDIEVGDIPIVEIETNGDNASSQEKESEETKVKESRCRDNRSVFRSFIVLLLFCILMLGVGFALGWFMNKSMDSPKTDFLQDTSGEMVDSIRDCDTVSSPKDSAESMNRGMKSDTISKH